ncbi:MAG: UDP-N-acetylmuramoyl-tripeptide--D-alanyl-D-alanine ligase [Treponema sp.]|jgi:UDP-N-acetylmuramoyl-tripeptide--D-alanyl-D-alanine ligase|nr:UDP-N-acetylmuramoyl-tripeptide--D-alanyl-D-alanine ligase [Treponema sp.]
MAEILMRFDAARQALGCRFLDFRRDSGGGETGGFSSVHIDSREVAPGGLFVALAGSVHDGNRFVGAALKAGAVAALAAESALEDPSLALEETARKAGAVLFVLPDTLRGLQDLAAAYLSRFPGLLKVGITGSSGKTTTKEIAAAIAGQEKAVAINPGNLNSETGLPLAVFTVRSHHEVGIFEMGMNRRGEIRELARVLKPAIALITNIGTAHIGIFGNKRAILEEKKAIFSEFTGTELALIPEDETCRDELAEGIAGRVFFYGAAACHELGEVRDMGLEGTELIWEGKKVRFGLAGKHNLQDALAAIAIARAIPVSSAAIREGLASVKPLFGRSEILRGAVTVICDCYNANFESAAAAISFCDDLKWPGRKLYVIGSMLELGDSSVSAHRAIGSLLAASRADRIFLYGAETEAALASLDRVPGVFHTNAMEALAGELKGCLRSGDLVLLKGSRGCALERLSGVLAGVA